MEKGKVSTSTRGNCETKEQNIRGAFAAADKFSIREVTYEQSDPLSRVG